jgi:hypothetical protein
MIYCVSFLAVFFLSVAIDLACGPEPDPFDYYISFFHNNLQAAEGYQPFYFNGYTYMNGYTMDNEESERQLERKTNAREWADHLGKGVKPLDVEKAMYSLSDSVESSLFNKFLVYGILPDSLKKNTFLKRITLPSQKSALHYYLFAEGLEHLTKIREDQWDPKPVDSMAVDKKAKEAFSLAEKEKDSFLKLRYFYQAERLFHYAKENNAALKIHDNYIANIRSNSHVIGWALSLKAGEEWRIGNNIKAAYLFSRIFAEYPERRIQAYHSFLDAEAPSNQVIKFAKNKTERGYIYAITGFHTPHTGLASLKKVYAADPQSPMIGYLLGREINKIEEGYLTPRTNGSKYYGDIGYYEHTKYDSVKSGFVNYIPQLKAFCTKLATDNEYPEPELGHLAVAYLSWIQNDTDAGFKALAAIKNEHLRQKLYDEKQMINLLLLSKCIKNLDTAGENKLVPLLTWLDKKVRAEKAQNIDDRDYWGNYDLKYYSASSRDFYAKMLAPLYFKQKDTVMAALCILRSERTIYVKEYWDRTPEHGLGFDMPRFWQNSLHSYHLKKILKLKNLPVKTSYLKLLMAEFEGRITKKKIEDIPHPGGGYTFGEIFSKSTNDIVININDLLGTAYLREHKYDSAVIAFKHINIAKLEKSTIDAYDDSLLIHYHRYPDPFYDGIHDYSGSFLKKKVKGYSKLDFAINMAKLQQQIKTHPQNGSKYYYEMANGLYNTSYYGIAWFYTAYIWADEDKYKINRFYYDKDYLRESKAEMCFLKARQLSKDPEFKARCTFMAAKCRQKKALIPESVESEYSHYKLGFEYKGIAGRYDKIVRNNPYFKDLKNHYSKTSFYKTAVNECSYLKDFLGLRRRYAKN